MDLDTYKKSIQDALDFLGKDGSATYSLMINNVLYYFYALVDKENLHKPGSALQGKAKDQLLALYNSHITQKDIYNALPWSK